MWSHGCICPFLNAFVLCIAVAFSHSWVFNMSVLTFSCDRKDVISLFLGTKNLNLLF